MPGLHDFVMANLPTDQLANLRRRDQADAFLASECKGGSEWGTCGMLFTDKYDTSAALKALSFRYRARVRGRQSIDRENGWECHRFTRETLGGCFGRGIIWGTPDGYCW